MTSSYPRDLHGYGPKTPDPRWPGGAFVALQFVVNYEEGGENNILHGDEASEAFLSEIVGAAPWPGQRHWNMESIYEYGARAGFWRLWRLFTSRNMPVTVFGVATALERSPAQVRAMLEADWEIASHGLKWIDYKDFSLEDERAHMREAIATHQRITGSRPLGWYTGRCSMRTLDLVAEDGGLVYTADSYADDLPYFVPASTGPQLIVPYTLDANDMRFATPQGFNAGDQFFTYLKDSFDSLYEEGRAGSPKMMSVGLHCRLAGRPGRAAALARFLDYVQSHDRVWVARRIDIARHWLRQFGYRGAERPSHMDKASFVARYGSVFEHSPWIAQQAYDAGLTPHHDHAAGLHALMCKMFRGASRPERLTVLKAHPDLAGRLALTGQLTQASTGEQASAGLDRLTEKELAQFTALNERYVKTFGFPFIMAVKGAGKADILAAFKKRVEHDAEQEFTAACAEVERIARLRLRDMLPETDHTY